MERVVRERMTTEDVDTITPQTIINIRPVVAALKEFFGSSQLSQFMDQTNSLAGLTHRRRLSALGAGGLTRERAPIEVRDVHPTHYGRMCPIETPEGPNIGLIGSLASYGDGLRVRLHPDAVPVVKGGKVTDEIVYLDASEEAQFTIAQAPSASTTRPASSCTSRCCAARRTARRSWSSPEGRRVHGRVAGADRLGRDGADPVPRAQRREPRADGLEHAAPGRAAADPAGAARRHRARVPRRGRHRRRVMSRSAAARSSTSTPRRSWSRAATATATVRAGQVHALEPGHADPPEAGREARRQGQGGHGPRRRLVDGRWRAGARARTCSSRSCRGRATTSRTRSCSRSGSSRTTCCTSIHIHEYEIDARSTKLGDEEITRDIPNRSEESLADLDERGVVRIGAEVGSGDLLVGKVTPKGETELTAEEKLIRAIFKEKAREVRDTSLKVPHGEGGKVIGVKMFSRDAGDDLPPGVNELVRVFVAKKRKIAEGDKLAGRHGNKGVISKIVPEEDMPFLDDGRPVDVVLNPLGVPSRMNIGQILETHLGWAAAHGVLRATPIGVNRGPIMRRTASVATPVFDGASRDGCRRGARPLAAEPGLADQDERRPVAPAGRKARARCSCTTAGPASRSSRRSPSATCTS